MLEPLISSRIRRTLLEYLLIHPNDRFYLRGLSKELNLSVSPLRRELKRLERSGMLAATPEGNLLFYAVNISSPAYLQLKSLGTQDTSHKTQVEITETSALSLEPPRYSWRIPMIIGGAAAVVVLLFSAGIAYVGLTNQRLSMQLSRALPLRKDHLAVIVPPHSASGVMHGARWRVVPGGFGGGFNASSSDSEAY